MEVARPGSRKRSRSPSVPSDGTGQVTQAQISVKEEWLSTLPDELAVSAPFIRLTGIAVSAIGDWDMVGRCDFLKNGGSIYDDAGKWLVEDAREKRSYTKSLQYLLVPTTTETAIAVSLHATGSGLIPMILCPPGAYNTEQLNLLEALGADVVMDENYLETANILKGRLKEKAAVLDEWEETTHMERCAEKWAEEILHAFDGKLDVLVFTRSGSSRKEGVIGRWLMTTLSNIDSLRAAPGMRQMCRFLKRRLPSIHVVEAVLETSNNVQDKENPQEFQKHQGMAALDSKIQRSRHSSASLERSDIDKRIVDECRQASAKSSYVMARRMIRKEGLLCGVGSGGVVTVAVSVVHHFRRKSGRCLAILPDGARSDPRRLLNDEWMCRMNYVPTPIHTSENYSVYRVSPTPWWATQIVCELVRTAPSTVKSNVTCRDAVEIMQAYGYDQLPVVEENSGTICGVISSGNLAAQIAAGRCQPETPVSEMVYRGCKTVSPSTTLAMLASIFDTEPFVVIVSPQRIFSGATKVTTRLLVMGVVTRLDLLSFITDRGNNPTTQDSGIQ